MTMIEALAVAGVGFVVLAFIIWIARSTAKNYNIPKSGTFNVHKLSRKQIRKMTRK